MDGLIDIFKEHGILAVILAFLGWFTFRLVWYVIKQSADKVEGCEKKLETAYAQRLEVSEHLAAALEEITVALQTLAAEQKKIGKKVMGKEHDNG